jgi:hypothetical protein
LLATPAPLIENVCERGTDYEDPDDHDSAPNPEQGGDELPEPQVLEDRHRHSGDDGKDRDGD